jgi:hypothetical protein
MSLWCKGTTPFKEKQFVPGSGFIMEMSITLSTDFASDMIAGRRSKRTRKEVQYYESEDESLAYDSEEGSKPKVSFCLQQPGRN